VRLSVGAERVGGAYTRMLERSIALRLWRLWSQAMLAAVTGASLAAWYGARWSACLCAVPVVIAIAGKTYENAALVLPDGSRHR